MQKPSVLLFVILLISITFKQKPTVCIWQQFLAETYNRTFPIYEMSTPSHYRDDTEHIHSTKQQNEVSVVFHMKGEAKEYLFPNPKEGKSTFPLLHIVKNTAKLPN